MSAGLTLNIPGISPDDVRSAIREGVAQALGDGIRAEVRAFLDELFGVLDKREAAAYLGVSERTIEQLWQDQKIPKITALGEKLPRTLAPALRELVSNGLIKARGTGLRALKPAA